MKRIIKTRKTRIKITAIILVAVILLTFFLVDFRRVHSFKKPIFSFLINSQDDGGSGEYKGVFYSYDIEGNFMPEDEYKGVTKYRFYIINKEIDSGLRD